jgi:hypothetical protein
MDGKDMSLYEFNLSYDDAMRFDDSADLGLSIQSSSTLDLF